MVSKFTPVSSFSLIQILTVLVGVIGHGISSVFGSPIIDSDKITHTTVGSGACSLVATDPMFKVVHPLPNMAGSEQKDSGSLPPELRAPLIAARNELVHAQLIFTAPQTAHSVITGNIEGALKGQATLRRVGYISLNLTFSESRPPGQYPATLNTDFNDPYIGGPDGVAVFYVSVLISSAAPSGIQPLTVTISTPDCSQSTKINVQISKFGLPNSPTQYTGAQFQGSGVIPFTPHGAFSAQTAYAFFKAMRNQRVNSLVWFEMSDLPWAPSFYVSDDQSVILNTTLHQIWWPKVLSLTGATAWRMPFSDRVHSPAHIFATNTTWPFTLKNKTVIDIPIFNGAAGSLNPEFEALFRKVFQEVAKYLNRQGWSDSGSWVQIIDEPNWWEQETLANTIAVMKLYKSVSPSVRIFQTRYPVNVTSGAVYPGCDELLDLVDWWCPHVQEWTTPGVPDKIGILKSKRQRSGNISRVTLYDNGVPITEAPWERTRFQAWDVWGTNGTIDGTLSWYSINSYSKHDPWINPYPPPRPPSKVIQFPAGFGYQLWPPSPSHRNLTNWQPIESIVWIMLGAGLQDAEYLHALSRIHTPAAAAILAEVRAQASQFPEQWKNKSWGDDGYTVDSPSMHVANGSGIVNNLKFRMINTLDSFENSASAPR